MIGSSEPAGHKEGSWASSFSSSSCGSWRSACSPASFSTGAVAWFKHGGHPVILALILGVIALIVSGIIGARKENAAD